MRYDIAALGELLVDMTPYGTSGEGRPLYEVNPGGAPCNALAMAARLGSRTAFLGKVGDDAFGHMLASQAAAQGIDLGALRFDGRYSTTLAFVHLSQEGERSFSFCRKPGADNMLEPGEVDLARIRAARVFHFGTLSLTNEPVAQATRTALAAARQAGCVISFDPNLRPALWQREEALRAALDFGLAQAELLKLSDEELTFALGEAEPERGVRALFARYGQLRAVFLTLGARGCLCAVRDGSEHVPALPVARVVDSTGAGDCFCGCCLHTLAPVPKQDWDLPLLTRAARLGAAAASLLITRRGALGQMPTRAELAALGAPL